MTESIGYNSAIWAMPNQWETALANYACTAVQGIGYITPKVAPKLFYSYAAAARVPKRKTLQQQSDIGLIFRQEELDMERIKKSNAKAPSVSYNDWLIEKLKDHDLAVEYLNNALKEGLSGDSESLELLLLALRNVIQAQGGVAKIAKKAGLGRESLYKTVSEKGNPEFRTIAALTHALGIELHFR